MRSSIFLTLVIFLLTGCQSGFYRGPHSDHFNGVTFFNPGEEHHPRTKTEIFQQGQAILHQRWRKAEPWHIDSHALSQPKSAIKITFINHSTALIQTNKLNLLTDPIWSYRASALSWIGPNRLREPGIALTDLPPIQVVVISHNHYDHLDIETLKQLNQSFHPVFIVPLGNKVFLDHYHIDHVVELDWWQHIKINNMVITLLPAEHWSARWLTDVNKTLWGSYGFQVNQRKIYFAGDTGYSPHFKLIRARWGKPDLALLPIGAYIPRKILKSVHMDPAEAVQAYQDLGATCSLGIHYGTFMLSGENMAQPIRDLHIACRQQHVSRQQFFLLTEGNSWYLP